MKHGRSLGERWKFDVVPREVRAWETREVQASSALCLHHLKLSIVKSEKP
jgi:hypothetical protein